MKTRTAPWDYQKSFFIQPQVIKLCEVCGANMAMTRFGLVCCGCRSTKYVELFETQAETFRRGLREKQEEAARLLALDCLPQMDVFIELIGEALNMDAETEALLNSWIEENKNLYPEGSDNRPSAQWLEHGYY